MTDSKIKAALKALENALDAIDTRYRDKHGISHHEKRNLELQAHETFYKAVHDAVGTKPYGL